MLSVVVHVLHYVHSPNTGIQYNIYIARSCQLNPATPSQRISSNWIFLYSGHTYWYAHTVYVCTESCTEYRYVVFVTSTILPLQLVIC